MKKELAVTPKDKFDLYIKEMKGGLAGVLPAGLSIDRMVHLAQLAGWRNPDLYTCTKKSVALGIITAIQLGLEPDGASGQAYLIPFNEKTGRNAKLVIGYKGLMEIAYRSGLVESIDAHVVYECDEFDYQYGTNEFIKFKPDLKARDSLDGPGEMVCVFASAFLKSGITKFVILNNRDLLAAKGHSASSSGKSSPWNTHFEEMAKKTAIRKLCKYLPVGIDMAKAVAVDEANEYGGTQADLVLDNPEVVFDALSDEEAQPEAQDMAQSVLDKIGG